MTRRYRCLTEGHTYRYQAALGKGDDTRRGQTCTVVTVPRPGCIGNALVRFGDGHQAMVPAPPTPYSFGPLFEVQP